MQSAAEIDDGDLVLRPWQDEDRAAVGVWLDDEVIGRYFGSLPGGLPERDPEAPMFAILEHGVPVGRIWCAWHKRPFEVGYFLRQDAWGRGLATRSLVLVCAWMAECGETELVLCTHPENAASQRVAARAGFEPAGEIANYAQFKDGSSRALRFRKGV
jgi:RimJ/RimL family protein N-acetyltransferase